jgi:hypothetical protein
MDSSWGLSNKGQKGNIFGLEKKRIAIKYLKMAFASMLLFIKCMPVAFVDISVSGPAASHRLLRHGDRQSRILNHEEEDLNQPNLTLNFNGLQLNY